VGKHDKYGKKIFEIAIWGACETSGANIQVDYKDGGSGNIDGVLDHQIAIEIESRVSKQVRGALVDLIFHQYPKKLMIFLPVYMNDPKRTVAQCKFILSRFVNEKDFLVVLLCGHGNDPQIENDVNIVRQALVV